MRLGGRPRYGQPPPAGGNLRIRGGRRHRSVRSTCELPPAAVRSFEKRLGGEVVRPGGDGYEQARRVWNAAVDRRPALIARPRTAAGVIAAVDFARAHGLPLAVRGGGHSLAGYGTVDGGLVVDLSRMKRLDADPGQRVARAEPGPTWGEYNARTITFVSKAPPLPFIPASAHGTPVHMILPCYTGDLDAGQRALAPLRALAGRTPLADTTGPTPYPALHALTASAGASRPHAARNTFLRELSDQMIEIILAFVHRATSPFGLVALRELGGAVARVPVDATAFAHRDKAFYLAADNAWEDDRPPDHHIAWTEEFWRAIAPHSDGAYSGYLGDEGGERVRSAYSPAGYHRLAAIKRDYDPDNVFRLNPNIPPPG